MGHICCARTSDVLLDCHIFWHSWSNIVFILWPKPSISMIYLPEILPITGVTIAIFARSVGWNIEYLFEETGSYSPSVMIAILAAVSGFSLICSS